jgi:hypothetical protein
MPREMLRGCWGLLQLLLHDRRQTWDLQPDGTDVQRKPRRSDDRGVHQLLMDLTRERLAPAGALSIQS